MRKIQNDRALFRLSNGVALPLLDIDDPAFARQADYAEYLREDAEMDARGASIAASPRFVKWIIKRLTNVNGDSLGGVKTLILKLGPEMLEGVEVPPLQRWFSRQFTSRALRVRLIRTCAMQAEFLRSKLEEGRSKDVLFINVGGGPSTDSINVLLSLGRRNRRLLKGRKIEIAILDMDDLGPEYAIKALDALKRTEDSLRGLDIGVRAVKRDWSNAEGLSSLLDRNRITIYASEGGIFEYGSLDDISNNLRALREGAGDDVAAFGSVLKPRDEVNKGYAASADISGIGIRYWGLEGIRSAIEAEGWKIAATESVGTIFDVFELRRSGA
jgi:hypothetical protein